MFRYTGIHLNTLGHRTRRRKPKCQKQLIGNSSTHYSQPLHNSPALVLALNRSLLFTSIPIFIPVTQQIVS